MIRRMRFSTDSTAAAVLEIQFAGHHVREPNDAAFGASTLGAAATHRPDPRFVSGVASVDLHPTGEHHTARR